jgi:hypothetical protein
MYSPDLEFLKSQFYEPLFNKLDENKEIVENSIILSLLSRSSNTRYDYLKQSSVLVNSIDQDVIDILINKKFIRITDEHNRYQITAYGVWEIEKDRVRFERLLEIFDSKYFDVFTKNKPLSSKEKVALLGLIAARTFSERAPLNRDNGKYVLENWKQIIEKSEIFLLEQGIISKKIELNKNEHVEPAVSYLFRRLNDLTKKTRNLYKSSNNNAYLDLYNYEGQEFNIDGLSYLFWKIFENKLNPDLEDKIFYFCDRIVKDYKPVIFNPEEFKSHIFSKIEYDDIFKDALFKAELNIRNYELRES